MIHTIAQKAANTGFAVEEKLSDDTGAYSYLLTRGEDRFYLVVKEYAYKNLASFMKEVVDRAAAQDAYLLFYEDDNESSYVFDGVYVRDYARPSTGPSKTKDTEWRESELSEGCRLGDFLQGTDAPETIAGGNSTLGQFA